MAPRRATPDHSKHRRRDRDSTWTSAGGPGISTPWSWHVFLMLVTSMVALLWVSSRMLWSMSPQCDELLAVAEHRIAELQRLVRDMEAHPGVGHAASPAGAAWRPAEPEPRASAAEPGSEPRASAAAELRGRVAAAAQGRSGAAVVAQGPAGVAAVIAPAAGSCRPKCTSSDDDGYADEYRGWFDVQGCGRCFDFCRWVGDSGSGGDPRQQLILATSWWSCRLAGTDDPRSPPTQFVSWPFARCSGEGAAAPAQVVVAPKAQIVAGSRITEEHLKSAAARHAIGVVVVVCKRAKYLERTMNSLLAAPRDADKFPLVISQDAHDPAMTRLVELEYVAKGLAHRIHHEHEANAEEMAKTFGKVKHTIGYVRIAQHFGFVMRKMFDSFGFEEVWAVHEAATPDGRNFQAVIFVEEDMEVAPDFFSYFGAMMPLLQQDKDLFCVSAWNDNGYGKMVLEPRRAYRTDFFPGLGWMVAKSFWGEIRDRWAVAYWDEFMRRRDVRRERKCIRPDVSRSYTFGSEGTSSGQFFKKHLSKIKLNDVVVDWQGLDLGYLSSTVAFDDFLAIQVRSAKRVSGPEEIEVLGPGGDTMRVRYESSEYKHIAKRFSLMEDEKEGIRRMSYRGVIPFAWGGRRVYLYTGEWPPNLD